MSAAGDIVVVGVTHHTAPVEVRERLALTNGDMERLLTELVAEPTINEAVVLSTCNRVEVVATSPAREDAAAVLRRRLLERGAFDDPAHAEQFFELHGREAVRHVFRVAASLDSMVVGEPQILGQLKEQFALSSSLRAAGPVLHRVFHKGFSVAKRVRTETGVAGRAVSLASVAVDLARKIFETIESRSVMLIGTGEIGEAAARSFAAAGAARIMVVNRSFEPAVALARELGGTPVPFERMDMYLPLADLVVGAAAGGELIDHERVLQVMRERKNRPVFFIDLAVPRNFDSAINAIDNAYLYDVDDLQSVVSDNLEERRRDAIEGEAIVEEEVDRFWRWFEQLDIEPSIAELRTYADAIRREEFERTFGRDTQIDAELRDRIERMSNAIVNKLLHPPTAALKGARDRREKVALVAALRELFALGRKP